MPKVKGIQKLMNGLNRSQQRKDWALLISKVGKELPNPDWNISVKKIDNHLENICKETGIDFKTICGAG